MRNLTRQKRTDKKKQTQWKVQLNFCCLKEKSQHTGQVNYLFHNPEVLKSCYRIVWFIFWLRHPWLTMRYSSLLAAGVGTGQRDLWTGLEPFLSTHSSQGSPCGWSSVNLQWPCGRSGCACKWKISGSILQAFHVGIALGPVYIKGLKVQMSFTLQSLVQLVIIFLKERYFLKHLKHFEVSIVILFF